jgi:hypothetical protein
MYTRCFEHITVFVSGPTVFGVCFELGVWWVGTRYPVYMVVLHGVG